MTDIPALKLKHQICHSLYSATNALIRAYRPLLDQLGLTYAQYLVMLALWDEDKVIIKSLVQRTRFDAGTLTPILKRLESKQLLTMVKASTDSRQKVIVLTGQGKALAERARRIPDNISGKIDMPADDAQQLKALAEQLYALINTNLTGGDTE
ncbi:MAG: MarR family transcriptional regulator [Zhongshania sp.]|uniref:MarR family winged helix-turn-helix transcriptional regulator n=1 Tax=Zhongshania sp. TaxID=1971902 RepID=UPI002626991F|nr:MarR family transcriptional regulator [Zhongshania sp.]MDF1694089.1 MarR family transcriptional regulator [Zhongshania sp.]